MRNLYERFPFIKDLKPKRRQQFEEYFYGAPLWVLDSCRVVHMAKNQILVKENAIANTIYFVGSGVIKAVDYRVFGIAYDFMRFDDVYAFGGLEVLTKDRLYRTTLQTGSECVVLKMPREIFEKWLDADPRVLRLEAMNVSKYLLEQARRSRACIFLQGPDRLGYILLDMYERQQTKGILTMRIPQEELAELCGVSVKTVYRSFKLFEKNGWITRNGRIFTMNEQQYELCGKYISSIVER